MSILPKKIRFYFSAAAGLFVVGMAIWFALRWYFWIGRLPVSVYHYPQLPLSVAFFFFVLGASLVLVDLGKKALPEILGPLIAILALLDLSDELFHFGVDVDQMISSIFYSDHQRHFLRTAPNSSTAAICTGLAIYFLSRRGKQETAAFIANILGGIASAIGIVSLFGYSAGIASAYTWRNFLAMSPYTATGFAILGLAISYHALENVSIRKRRVHAPLLVAFSLMVVTLQLYRVQREAELHSIQESTNERAMAISNQLVTAIDEHILSVIRMGNRWKLENGTPYAVWKGDSDEFLRTLQSFSHLCWVNARGETKWCNPEKEWITVDQTTFERAIKGSEPLLEGMSDGDSCISVFVPVTKNAHHDGVLLALLRFDSMFGKNFDFSTYSVNVVFKDRVLFRSPSDIPENEWTKRISIDYRHLNFSVDITPLPKQLEKYQSKIPFFVLFFGIILSWAIAYAAYLFIITREDAKKIRDRLVWEQAISTGSDLIFITMDQKGMIKSFNPAAEKFFEYGANEVVDRATPLIWHDPQEIKNYAEKIAKDLGHAVPANSDVLMVKAKDGKIDRAEWTFITKSGALKKGELSVHLLKGRRDETVGYVGIVRDITEQRRTEAKLIHSSKMASLGEMAGGVAHEINNPLTIIQGRTLRMLQLSQKPDGISPEVLSTNLKIMVDMTRRIAKIIKGLATFSRDADLDPLEPTELTHILEDTLELCRERFLEHRINFEVAPFSDVILSCRPTQISQVLLNLLNNAFDAVVNISERWVRVQVICPDERVVQIRVTDSGKRISDEVAAKIMDPFFTTKGVGKGTGLGLSISKGIVEVHGGRLFLDRDSHYTSFVVEFPLHQ